jgi:hypothetical protein
MARPGYLTRSTRGQTILQLIAHIYDSEDTFRDASGYIVMVRKQSHRVFSSFFGISSPDPRLFKVGDHVTLNYLAPMDASVPDPISDNWYGWVGLTTTHVGFTGTRPVACIYEARVNTRVGLNAATGGADQLLDR